MRRNALIAVFCSGLSIVILGGCPPAFSDLCSGAQCGATDGGITDGGRDSNTSIDGCDPTKELSDSPKCIDDKEGIFVAPGKMDTAAGTKTDPVGSIAAALTLAGTTKTRIYVCEGIYDAPVTITKTVSIYGGLTCGTWEPLPAARATIAPRARGLGLTIANTQDVWIIDVDVKVMSGAEPGESSVGALIWNSKDVVLRRVTIVAGDGADAIAQGEPPSNLIEGSHAGNPGNGQTPGLQNICACRIWGTSHGGGGGLGANAGASTNPGERGGDGAAVPMPAPGSTGTNGGGGYGWSGTPQPVPPCSDGHPGQNGAPRVGGRAATVLGTVTEKGWNPTSGSDGEAGNPGMGGGGAGGNRATGSSYELPGAGGGSGGCGGCGGNGGLGGKGGGGSIALLMANAHSVRLESGHLMAKKGGHAGAGSAGGSGAGGWVGAPVTGGGCAIGGSAGSGAGGAGGSGAGGGGGAGGSGGVSVGIGYSGEAPVVRSDLVIDVGSPGNAGTPAQGGAGGGGITEINGQAGALGKPGVAEKMLNLANP